MELKQNNKTEICWNKKVPSRSSPKRVEIFCLSSARNCLDDSCMGPGDSTAMGWKIYWVPRFAYLAVSRSAADFAADPALLAAASRYDIATGQTAVTSCGINVIPSRHLPSVWDIPLGSLVTAMLTETNEQATISFRLWCLAHVPSCRWNFEPRGHQPVPHSDIGVESTWGDQASVQWRLRPLRHHPFWCVSVSARVCSYVSVSLSLYVCVESCGVQVDPALIGGW